MNKKVRVIMLSVIVFLILSLTTTYGLWYVTRNQTNSNVIATKCLDISLTNEANDITLPEAYPITDEEGLKLTPYTFRVTNNCNRSIDYQLNLELLGNSENSVSSSAIKVSLNDNTTILSNKEIRETTIENAYTSYQLMYGRLEAKESEEHSLRLWVDEDAPVSESNKVFESKVSIKSGQGIENPFNEGTIAFNIVGNAGGTGYVTELNSEWQEGEFGEVKEKVKYCTDNYYWGTNYKFDAENGNYTLSGNIVQATISECRATAGLCGEYTLENTESGNATSLNLYKIVSLKDDSANFADSLTFILLQEKNSTLVSEFKETIPANGKLHQAQDDYGTSYYYRGAVQNNYVKFGKWAESGKIRGYDGNYHDTFNSFEECQNSTYFNRYCQYEHQEGDDMYWRIIRINGDGTIRMIYDGTQPIANKTPHIADIGGTLYNKNADDIKYVGYTYEGEDGTPENSTIKSLVDAWYDTNLESNYGKYITDNIFCNDKGIQRYEYRDSNYNLIINKNEAIITYAYFFPSFRINNYTPKLTCNQKEDRYTVSSKLGNGYLSNPVGLITVDEVYLSGENLGYLAPNYDTFYSDFWTMSPYSYWEDHRYSPPMKASYVYRVSGSGYISKTYPVDGEGTGDYRDVARPVISLKSDIEFFGEGTIDNPYDIILN